VTLFAFRQRVHTYARSVRPPSLIRTFCRFGLKRRLVATIEWLRELPTAGRLPQLWQTRAMGRTMVAGRRLTLRPPSRYPWVLIDNDAEIVHSLVVVSRCQLKRTQLIASA
jgi:hypothetical protein